MMSRPTPGTCPGCGRLNPPGQATCLGCGTPIPAPGSAAPPPGPPPPRAAPGTAVPATPGSARTSVLTIPAKTRGYAVQVTDLGSRNGSQLGDRPLPAHKAQAWDPGDWVRVGGHWLRWEMPAAGGGGQPAAPAAPRGDPFATRFGDAVARPPVGGAPAAPAAPTVRIQEQNGQTRQIPLSAAGLTLGRGPDSDITLDNEFVSWQHLRIDRAGDGVTITDLDSRNGTILRDQRLPARQPAQWGDKDRVKVGPYTLTWERAPAAPARGGGSGNPRGTRVANAAVASGGGPPPPTGQAAPRVHLLDQNGQVLQTFALTEGGLTVGRDADNQIVLDDDLVSRHHLRIELGGPPAVAGRGLDRRLALIAGGGILLTMLIVGVAAWLVLRGLQPSTSVAKAAPTAGPSAVAKAAAPGATPGPTASPGAAKAAEKAVILPASSPAAAASPGVPAADWGTVSVKKGTPLKIGLAGSLSGDNEKLGVAMRRGAELAIDDAKDVKGFKVELVPQDDACTEEGGRAAAQKIVADKQIVGVIGHICSNASVPASTIYDQAHVAMISPASTAPELTSRNNPIANRVTFNSADQSLQAAKFVKDTLKLEKAAIIHDGTSYGQRLAFVFREQFASQGGKVTTVEGASPDQKDFLAILKTIAANKPDVLYFTGSADSAAALATQLQETGPKDVRLIGTDDLLSSSRFVDNAGPAANGTYATAPNVQTNIPADFDKRYQAKFGEKSGLLDTFSYDATALLLAKIGEVANTSRAGDLDVARNDLARAIRSTKKFPGVTGTLSCESNGDCGGITFVVRQFDKGSWNDVPQ